MLLVRTGTVIDALLFLILGILKCPDYTLWGVVYVCNQQLRCIYQDKKENIVFEKE